MVKSKCSSLLMWDNYNKVHMTNVHYNIPYQWVPFHSTIAWYSPQSPLDWNLVRSLSIQFQFRRFHSWEPEAQRDSTTRARSWGCLRRGTWVECRQWAGTGVGWGGLATWRCTYAWSGVVRMLPSQTTYCIAGNIRRSHYSWFSQFMFNILAWLLLALQVKVVKDASFVAKYSCSSVQPQIFYSAKITRYIW